MLSIFVEREIRAYFAKEQNPKKIYNKFNALLEKPLIAVVLEYTRGNQLQAAKLLGLNRNTLRKKMKCYGFIQ